MMASCLAEGRNYLSFLNLSVFICVHLWRLSHLAFVPEQREIGVNHNACGANARLELKSCLPAGGDHHTEAFWFSRHAYCIERHSRDECFFCSRLFESAGDDERVSARLHFEFHGVARQVRATHPLIEEPVHTMRAVQVHRGSHVLLDGVLEIGGGERAKAVLSENRAE